MNLSIDNLAAVIIVTAIVIDKVMSMLKQRGVDIPLIASQIAELHERHGKGSHIERQIDDLHRWHDVSDNEGVKLWYVRRSLEDAINKLADNVDVQTKLWDRIDRRLEAIENQVIK